MAVCCGDNIPEYGKYKTIDPQFTKFHPYPWKKHLFVKQQETFFKILEKYKVHLIFPKTKPELIWQMYIRDTAFVVGSKLFYSKKRKFKSRTGEIDELLKVLPLSKDQIISINASIEGGDVLVTGKDTAVVGLSSRTSPSSVKELSNYLSLLKLKLGQLVMHLDTRLTLLPNNLALISPQAFSKEHLALLGSKYQLLEVTIAEAKRLGTNVFVINPETICVPKEHQRLIKVLEKRFKVESIDYSEPINLAGSFRCTTLPLVREETKLISQSPF